VHSGRTINFLPYTDEGGNAIAIDCVLDITGLGEVVGIEMIGLASQTDGEILVGVTEAFLDSGEAVRFSYDAKSDAFYVRVPGGRSLDQVAASCVLVRDSDGHLVRLVVDPGS
jgi:hypothetical protein